MAAAGIPQNEQDRLRNLYSYELLYTLPEKEYDDITKLASQICDSPISLVTLVDADKQWFKSAFGTSLTQTPREYAFCAHAILQPGELMEVTDAVHDERFAGNPLVTSDPHIAFYAGVPLISEEGFAIGSLCVLDTKPKQLTDTQQQSLKILGNQVLRLMELHKRNKELLRSRQLLQEVNKELEKFVKVAAENLKAPCDNAIEITDLVTEKFSDKLDVDGVQLLSLIRYSCEGMKTTIDKTLEQAKLIGALQDKKTLFTFSGLMQELKQQLPDPSGDISLNYLPNNNNIYFFKNILLQILSHIIIASVSFNDKDSRQIEISFRQSTGDYQFTLADNGKGIPVFSRNGGYVILPSTGCSNRNDAYTSHLNQARQLVNTLSGTFEISFEENKGTSILVSLPK